MSKQSTGAASAASGHLPAVTDLPAAPALVDQWEADVLARIEQTDDPASAEELFRGVRQAEDAVRLRRLGEERARRWAALTLIAERRWGQLLPPKSKGGRPPQETVTGSHSSASDRKQQERARKVFDIPETVFEDYLQSALKPSREGLLRKAREAKGGPAPRRRSRARPKRPRATSWNGKSIRGRRDELGERKKAGYTDLLHLQMMLNRTCGQLSTVDLDDYALGETTMWLVADMHDDLISLAEWLDRALGHVQMWLEDTKVREKIVKLRDTTGRSVDEADTALKLAARLERKLDARLQAADAGAGAEGNPITLDSDHGRVYGGGR